MNWNERFLKVTEVYETTLKHNPEPKWQKHSTMNRDTRLFENKGLFLVRKKRKELFLVREKEEK